MKGHVPKFLILNSKFYIREMNIIKKINARINRILHPGKGAAEKFHREYYYSKVWSETYWLGKHVFKCPLDLWVYQEIIFETKPNLIIETGTFHGGSALFFANLLDILEKGEVVTIDVDRMPDMPVHKRITYIEGSSISPEVIEKVIAHAKGYERVMVFLDSDHTKTHVLKELEAYGKLVSKDCYLIVEDTNLNGHPVYSGFGQGPGPMEAVEEFLMKNKDFVPDTSREKFMLSFNPLGFLRKQ